MCSKSINNNDNYPAWKNPNPKRKRETMMMIITVMIIQELMRGYEAARSKLTAQMEVVKTLQRVTTKKDNNHQPK